MNKQKQLEDIVTTIDKLVEGLNDAKAKLSNYLDQGEQSPLTKDDEIYRKYQNYTNGL